ncbi:hypothetical protein B3286c1_0856 [Brucella vulpis]|uniref:hypothetical protein n=1 Tax=Brucella vulpis TaxID=981386 RepID=UPI00073AB1FC|nr:hypothetical protein BF3285c1_0857 [Brucella vulpis]CUW49686.1 hypothetical protein B3286c1_0856 [Brucella vulpis]
MKNPSIFGSSQKRGVLIPICSRFESVTFRESEAILTLPEVCQQSEAAPKSGLFIRCFGLFSAFGVRTFQLFQRWHRNDVIAGINEMDFAGHTA